MRTIILVAVMAGSLAACDDGTQQATNQQAAASADKLQAGEYALTAKVDALRSTDKSTPASAMKIGDTKATTTCIGDDGQLQKAAFVEANETCTGGAVYISGGRISMQLQCSRPGKGQLTQLVDGDFDKGDSFTAKVTTTTYFSGSGDYELVRSVTGKRTGACSAKK